ncbi:hypothetical protein LMG7974_00981 [Campylobacter majalis]|uniref:DNA-binding protein n=1 Tax=Campylobacter majalis TaxID=2790656 RepID=A0ABN7K7H9_9BACT|nr:DNA-binding protein [Campylobacter majalis]CAD7288380.1 hypothetical protein LMG7974_00981 [Campylobacter majalis]
MRKLQVSEAAQELGISKEAVYNRIRRGSLKSSEEDGVKYVLFDDEAKSDEKKTKSTKTQKNTTNSDKFIEFLLNELSELKSQNQNLQSDKEKLYKEKEQMLVNSKAEIMAVYKDKDEKLMQFLNILQKPSLTHDVDVSNTEPVIDAELDDEVSAKFGKFIGLNEYLKELNLDKKTYKKAQKKIIKRINKSKFVKFKDGVIMVKRDKSLYEIIGEI